MADNYFTAVVDFGKTNKKVLLYDRDLRILASRRRTFREIEIEGYRCDDIEGAMAFVREALAELAREFAPIRAIAFTTHGATFTALDEKGALVFPTVSYDMEPPPGLREEFHRAFGGATALQAATMTPPLPLLINPGFGIFCLQRRDPARFKKTARIVFLPQYLGYLMTGKLALEPTYIGCHTYLWDFAGNRPSSVAEGLGIAAKLGAPLRAPWEAQGRVKPELAAALGLPDACVVTCGIHDSNASLLPYLLKEEGGDFILNSTGTWCVAMSPGGRFPLAEDALGKEVFFNLSAFGKPVKTAICRGGAECAFWGEKLGGGREHPADLDAAQLRKVFECGAAVLPTLFPGSGMFPRSRASLVRAERLLADADLAFAALDLGLAIQSRAALKATNAAPNPAVFIEGGFRNNGPYVKLLAALMPAGSICLSDMEEATAFGAAITAKCAVEGITPRDAAAAFTIATTPLQAPEIEGLEAYAEEFAALCGAFGAA